MENMVMRVQHVDGEYRVVLSAEAMAELQLKVGAEVEVKPVAGGGATNGASVETRYAATEEVLQAFRDTLPQHEFAYRELAK